MSDTTCGQLHQRPITSASNYISVQLQPHHSMTHYFPHDIYCIAPCCQVGNLYANTGHGSKGWTYSWGSAVLLAKVETKQ